MSVLSLKIVEEEVEKTRSEYTEEPTWTAVQIWMTHQVLDNLKTRLKECSDASDLVKEETERCAQICDAMVIGGRTWNHDQEVTGGALLSAAVNIRKKVSI